MCPHNTDGGSSETALLKILHLIFQSLLDFVVSVVLLLSTVTVKDPYKVYNEGILGWMECRMWNTKFLLWGLFTSSTWNIVALTFERFVCKHLSVRHHSKNVSPLTILYFLHTSLAKKNEGYSFEKVVYVLITSVNKRSVGWNYLC